MTEHVDGIVAVPEKSREYLNERQLLDYRTHREQLIKWTLTLGKDPDKAEGYAHEIARQRAYRPSAFWVVRAVERYPMRPGFSEGKIPK